MSIFDKIKRILTQNSSTDEKLDILIEVINPPKTEKTKLETIVENDNSKQNESENKSYFDKGIPLYEDIYIVYNDGAQETRRMINVRVINSKEDGDCYLDSYCYERQAHRTFLMSKIVEIADPYTGETISDPLYYFKGRYGNPDMKKIKDALIEAQKQILILVFLGKCDGSLKKSEKQIIFNLINKRSKYDLNYDLIDKELRKMNILVDDFRKIIKSANESLTQDEKIGLINAADELIRADKIIDPMEEATIKILSSVLNITQTNI